MNIALDFDRLCARPEIKTARSFGRKRSRADAAFVFAVVAVAVVVGFF